MGKKKIPNEEAQTFFEENLKKFYQACNKMIERKGTFDMYTLYGKDRGDITCETVHQKTSILYREYCKSTYSVDYLLGLTDNPTGSFSKKLFQLEVLPDSATTLIMICICNNISANEVFKNNPRFKFYEKQGREIELEGTELLKFLRRNYSFSYTIEKLKNHGTSKIKEHDVYLIKNFLKMRQEYEINEKIKKCKNSNERKFKRLLKHIKIRDEAINNSMKILNKAARLRDLLETTTSIDYVLGLTDKKDGQYGNGYLLFNYNNMRFPSDIRGLCIAHNVSANKIFAFGNIESEYNANKMIIKKEDITKLNNYYGIPISYVSHNNYYYGIVPLVSKLLEENDGEGQVYTIKKSFIDKVKDFFDNRKDD